MGMVKSEVEVPEDMVVALKTSALADAAFAKMPPSHKRRWIDHISEAEPWLTSLVGEPVYPITVAVAPLLALAFAIWNIVRNRQDRAAWLIYAGYLVVAGAVMLFEIRGARMATPLAVPGCAALIASAWRRQLIRRGLAPAFGLVASWIASAAPSLPVPVSPSISTVASLAAIRASCENTSRMHALSPIKPPNAELSDSTSCTASAAEEAR